MIVFDISSFFGRFHPLVVHLPIGFILLAVILEIYAGYKKINISVRVISFCWFDYYKLHYHGKSRGICN